MTDNERLVVCARDAINELLHRCQDLRLKKDELLMIREGMTSMVTFKSDEQEAARERLLKVLDQPGRELNRELS